MAQRSFQQRAQYQEGRKVRGSREARAMARSTRYGRKEQESAWKNAEVDALYQLAAAGVRVPQPFGFFNGVLVMELVTDAEGSGAALGRSGADTRSAREFHGFLMQQIVRMLCAGLIHGDLSEFNVLVDAAGPVIIDLPQAVNAAGNNNAFAMLRARRGQYSRHARPLCAGAAEDPIRTGDVGAVRAGRAAAGQQADRRLRAG